MMVGENVAVENIAVEAPVNVNISSEGSLIDSAKNILNDFLDKIRRADDEAMTLIFMTVMLGLTFRILWRSVE